MECGTHLMTGTPQKKKHVGIVKKAWERCSIVKLARYHFLGAPTTALEKTALASGSAFAFCLA
jgi:hypothetical protein